MSHLIDVVRQVTSAASLNDRTALNVSRIKCFLLAQVHDIHQKQAGIHNQTLHHTKSHPARTY